MRAFLFRMVTTHDLGWATPWVLGLVLGRWPRRVPPPRN